MTEKEAQIEYIRDTIKNLEDKNLSSVDKLFREHELFNLFQGLGVIVYVEATEKDDE